VNSLRINLRRGTFSGAALREVITAAVVQSDGAVRVEGDLVRALPAVVVADKTGEAEGTCTESATRIVFVFRKAG